jgi:hypothetical protein
MNQKPSDDSYTEEEAQRRMDEVLKRLLSTPPKPQSAYKVGKRKKPAAKKSKSK